jgi:hypothetical protein
MHTHCALPVQKPVSGAFLHPYDDVLQAEHEILHSRPSSLTDEKLQAVPIFFGVLTGMGKQVLMLWNCGLISSVIIIGLQQRREKPQLHISSSLLIASHLMPKGPK